MSARARSALRRHAQPTWPGGLIAPLLAGCEPATSALVPAGADAAQLALLFWWMCAGALLIWLLVMALMYRATRPRPQVSRQAAHRLILFGGVVLPVLLLAALLAWGLSLLPQLHAATDGLRIHVSGERWWWRVRYETPRGSPVETANELHLPLGERVELTLESRDVIHALWIPPLGGKIDMIPGRRTRLSLLAEREGIYRGVCAEYCGTAHTLMAFEAVVTPRARFDDWLARQSTPRPPPRSAQAREGERAFLANGCGGCHRVRGSAADGVIGPDLTHLPSRHSLGAGTLANDRDGLRQWIANTRTAKPGVLMPAYPMLPQATLDAIVAYLHETDGERSDP